MKKLILIFLATASLVFGAMYLVANATTVFNSNQVGTNPITGYYLETNGATSTWAAVSGGGGSITINGVSSTVFSLNSSTYLGITRLLCYFSKTQISHPISNLPNLGRKSPFRFLDLANQKPLKKRPMVKLLNLPKV